MNAEPNAQTDFEKRFFEGDLPGVGEALDRGARVNDAIEGLCALGHAAKYGWHARAAILLERGASPWMSSYSKNSPASIAARALDRLMVELMASRSTVKPWPGKFDEILAEAARHSNQAIKTALALWPPTQRQEELDRGLADAWARGDSDRAICNFLGAGANPNFKVARPEEDESFLDGLDEDDWIPLALGLALRGNSASLAASCVEFPDHECAMLAVEAACNNIDPETLAAALSKGMNLAAEPGRAAAALERLCENNLQPLQIEWAERHARCVGLWVDAGAPVDGGAQGRTPLMLCLAYGCVQAAAALLERGADPLARRGRENVASMAARFMGDETFALAYAKAIAAREHLALALASPQAPSRPKPGL